MEAIERLLLCLVLAAIGGVTVWLGKDGSQVELAGWLIVFASAFYFLLPFATRSVRKETP